MSREIVFMYSGQGAQYYQMGRELWETDPVYRAALQRYSRLAGPIGGRDLTEVLFSRPMADSAEFVRLAETHPLLVAVSLALTDALAERGVRPDRLLGYSLGETIAAVVSGAMTPEEALWAVRAQAGLFERRAEPGRMIAVLARPDVLADVTPHGLEGRVHIACLNAPDHFVVGLAEGNTAALVAALERRSLPHAVLPVGFAFHTPLIAGVEDAFRDIAGQLTLARPRIPVHSCASGAVIEAFSAEHFWGVARSVVRFADTVAAFADQPQTALVDVGPAGTLAGFVRLATRSQNGAAPGSPNGVHVAMNQFGRDARTFQQVVDHIS